VWTYGYLLRRVYEVAEECGVKSDISLLAGEEKLPDLS
jgi:hypothetical protein